MFYNKSDKRSYISFIKLPPLNHKFTIGFKTLSTASLSYVIEFANDVAQKCKYTYADEPTLYCSEIGTIVGDDTTLAFCVSRGYAFQVVDGIPEANKYTMYYDQNDEKAYTYFVNLPQVENKFAVGCKNLSSATLVYLIDFAIDVAVKLNYSYLYEPIVVCLDTESIIVDDIALGFCISRGYSFRVFDGLNDVILSARENKLFNLRSLKSLNLP